jgi:hypothetical protein
MSNLVNRSVRKRCFHRGKYSFGKGGIYFSGVWKLSETSMTKKENLIGNRISWDGLRQHEQF